MPSKSTKSSKAQIGAAQQQTHHAEVVGWAKKLWGAIKDRSYALVHQDLFNEFDRLIDTTEGLSAQCPLPASERRHVQFLQQQTCDRMHWPTRSVELVPFPHLGFPEGDANTHEKVSKAAPTKTIPPPLLSRTNTDW
ncbi:hypothetical protein BYT27DRAFT_7255585 [Phlegmacium glaucopus]|nr:hypothetical protein BYT27DRAFT_7255585 [Phlegmacium glaucopus]